MSLSSLYGKFLVLLMLAFCLTEVMDNNIRPLLFQEWGLFIFTIFRCPRFELTLLKSRERRVSRNLGRLIGDLCKPVIVVLQIRLEMVKTVGLRL